MRIKTLKRHTVNG